MTDTVKFTVVVCGLEELLLKDATNAVFKINEVKSATASAITYDLSALWEVVPSVAGVTADDCPITGFKVCEDALCSTAESSNTSFSITDSTLTLSLASAIPLTTKYLAAVTSGGVINSHAVEILVCGGERISLTEAAEITLKQGLSTVATEYDVTAMFTNSNTLCPITSYTLTGAATSVATLSSNILKLDLS